MLNEDYVLRDKNNLALILFIFIMLSFQNWHFSSLTNQNRELINLNKEILSSYKDLIDNHLAYCENINDIKTIAEDLEKQNIDLMDKTKELNELFFD